MECIQDLSVIDAVDMSLSFVELGLDSLGLAEIARKLSSKTHRSLSVAKLFEHLTIEKLVRYLFEDSADITGDGGPSWPQPSLTANLPDSECAVRGVAMEYPRGIEDMQALQDFLSAGGDGVHEVPAERWDVEAYFADEVSPGRMYTRHGAFLGRDPYTFDEAYFGLNPRVVKVMDPQQRLSLETAAQAKHNSRPVSDTHDTGVFMGVMTRDFADELCKYQAQSRANSWKLCMLLSIRILALRGASRHVRWDRQLLQRVGWKDCGPNGLSRSEHGDRHCLLILLGCCRLGNSEHVQEPVHYCPCGGREPDAGSRCFHQLLPGKDALSFWAVPQL